MSSTRTRRGGAVEPASAAAAAPAGPVHPVNVLRYSACAGKTTPTVSSSPGVHRVFQHVLEHAGDSAASLLRSSNQATLLDIATFVHSCHHVANGSNPAPAAGPTRSEAGPSIRGGGIPTGVIMSGSSVQDRPLSLGALEAAILAKGPARFACASSANATSLGGVLASILGHFLGEQELPAKHCSSRNLLDWAATLEVMSPLVILIRDIEAFDPQVLSDLVGVMHQELHTLPIVLLLTVATTAQALPRMLPHAASSKLSVGRRFALPTAAENLDTLLRGLILDAPHGFLLGEGPLALLLDSFALHSQSLSALTQAFRYAIVLHFRDNRLARLCGSSEPLLAPPAPPTLTTEPSASSDDDEEEGEEGEGGERAKGGSSVGGKKAVVGGGLLAEIARLPSVRRCLQETGAIMLDASAPEFETLVQSWLTDIRSFRARLRCAVAVLQAAGGAGGEGARGARKAPSLPTLLRDASAGFAEARNQEEEAEKQGERGWPRGHSLDIATKGLKYCSTDALEKVATTTRDALAALVATLEDPVARHKAGLLRASAAALPALLAAVPKVDDEQMAAAISAASLKGKLGGRGRDLINPTLPTDPLRDLRDQACLLIEAVAALVPNPETLPLHEAFCLTRDFELSRGMAAAPRKTVHDALVRPGEYLTSDASDARPGEMPDAARLYRISLSEGRRINMPDWFLSFKKEVEKAEGKGAKGKGKGAKGKSDTAMTQARFVYAVTELQLAGLFGKSGKGAGDAAQRLVFPAPPPPPKACVLGSGMEQNARARPEAAPVAHTGSGGRGGTPGKRKAKGYAEARDSGAGGDFAGWKRVRAGGE